MNGSEFKRKLAEECQLTLSDSAEIYEAFIEIICDELKKGENVTLTGLGRFFTAPYSRKTVISPQGEEIEIKPHNVVKFKPSRQLRSLIAEG